MCDFCAEILNFKSLIYLATISDTNEVSWYIEGS